MDLLHVPLTMVLDYMTQKENVRLDINVQESSEASDTE